VTPARTTTSRSRSPRSRSDPPPATVQTALVPVADALLAAARASARTTLSDAEADARAELARARAEADHILDEARAEGAEAATKTAAGQLAAARRQAREMILGARRRAYDAVRSGAIEQLAREASTPEGRRLAERLEVLVRDRVGPSASVRRSGPDTVTAVAEDANRRAVLGPEALVDHALMSLADEIDAVWA